MTVKPIQQIVAEESFFENLDESSLRLVGGCAKNAFFRAGEYLFHEGQDADAFYLIRQGRVALEVKAPGRGAITFATLGAGDIVGVSWLVPPYRWTYDARAVDATHALSLDAACLRGKCEADHDFGYDMMKRFMPTLIQRLQSTRLQLLDVYGEH